MLGLPTEIFNSFVANGEAAENSQISNILIRVFIGGRDSVQQDKFADAMMSTRHIWDVKMKHFPRQEYLITDTAKDRGWGIVEIVDWLLESDIHFILNHVHQGITAIDCRAVNVNLQRLYHHPGFPNGEQLSCPIFQQDKFNYIRSIPLLTIPTLQILIHPQGSDELSPSEVREINQFMDTYNEGCGWHVKPTFTTNGEGNFLITLFVIDPRF